MPKIRASLSSLGSLQGLIHPDTFSILLSLLGYSISPGKLEDTYHSVYSTVHLQQLLFNRDYDKELCFQNKVEEQNCGT